MPSSLRSKREEQPLRGATPHDWLQGAYYRAYVLRKDVRDLRPAVHLLIGLRDELRRQDMLDTVLAARMQRIYGEVLLRRNKQTGRALFRELYERLNVIRENAGPSHEKEVARLFSDSCIDLMLAGMYEESIEIATLVAARPVKSESLHAHRFANLAVCWLQYGTTLRAAHDLTHAAEALDAADVAIDSAFERRDAARNRTGEWNEVDIREAHAVRLSILGERAWLGSVDPADVIEGFRKLLADTALDSARGPVPTSNGESPLQVAYRVGRLGSAHLAAASRLNANAEHPDVVRACTYLSLAWDYLTTTLIRAWVPLDLHDALVMAKRPEEARAFAAEALERLLSQCGSGHPVVSRLRDAADVGLGPAVREGRGDVGRR